MRPCEHHNRTFVALIHCVTVTPHSSLDTNNIVLQWLKPSSHPSLGTTNMTCKNPQPVLCRVLSQYFTTGVLSKLYCCSLVHSTNIIGMIGMTMNNWSFAVSSSPDENHCEMVTDTPSALLTQYILHSLLVVEVPLQEHGAQQYNQRQPCWTRISSACTLHTLVLNLVFLHVLTSKHYSKHALTMLYICIEW